MHAYSDRPLETTADIARHLGVTKLTIYRLASTGKIPVVRLSPRAIRFDRAAVMTALSANGTEGTVDAK